MKEMSNLYESLREMLVNIDTKDLSNEASAPVSVVIEEQKVYFWIRLYLSEEDSNLLPGDDITIKWKDEEELKTKFICYGKTGMSSDGDFMVRYDSEDNRKILCLMIDINSVNNNEDIPFIRTLFKMGIHYEYQLIKRDDLKFIVEKDNSVIDYFDSDF